MYGHVHVHVQLNAHFLLVFQVFDLGLQSCPAILQRHTCPVHSSCIGCLVLSSVMVVAGETRMVRARADGEHRATVVRAFSTSSTTNALRMPSQHTDSSSHTRAQSSHLALEWWQVETGIHQLAGPPAMSPQCSQ
eukprot:SAG31_NODE_5270_length_2640_cov_1.554900_2_plen_135_part_00